MAVEEPGWPPLREFAEGAGLRPVPLPVDDQGLRGDELERHPDVGAVLATPAHQFPTGVVLSPQRRNELLRWARRRDGLIIEDDYDAEFRYDRRPIGCLQGLAPDHVAVVGSTSKLPAPGLRFGWLITPPHWPPHVATARRTDGGQAVWPAGGAPFRYSRGYQAEIGPARLHEKAGFHLALTRLPPEGEGPPNSWIYDTR
ncbi:aminotransferase class I/II-fold pyridoxal phosphate-dependent enzyme [Sinosporangium siamense]|uniref:aminotransferase class I/II-fold pyridoxal phosphate-dependent enzyme n=1 Tax=Sinosporangium siamense TaxID=1367973 RepID=UPI0023B319C3